MRHYLDVQIVSRVGDCCEKRTDDGGEDEELGDGRVCKSRGVHGVGISRTDAPMHAGCESCTGAVNSEGDVQ